MGRKGLTTFFVFSEKRIWGMNQLSSIIMLNALANLFGIGGEA